MKTDERSKILIVDDEKINIDVLVGLLNPEYRTIAAKTGEQALKRLENTLLPDLVLLDIMMPGMDGYSVCRIIKDDPALSSIPVIFITSKSDEEDEAKGFSAGAVDYITKPFSPLLVRARVKTHIELKRKGDLLERLAGLDGLTGIPNRRHFDQFLETEWKRALRFGNVVSLAMIDIDFFKRFNDHYGHMAGDDCLRQVARAISRSMPRTGDLAARYGGEEFVCVLPETSEQGAFAVAERIMENIRELDIPHVNSEVSDCITISIGVATMCPEEASGSSLNLVNRADKALYLAKQGGRNRIMCHTGELDFKGRS